MLMQRCIGSLLCLLLMPGLVQARDSIEIGLATLTIDGKIPSRKKIQSFERQLGHPISTFNFFLGFNGDHQELPRFPLRRARKVLANYPGCAKGLIPMITWEPWGDEQTENGEWKSPFSQILDGNLDDYIAQFARDMKKYHYPIRLRFGHEMIQNDLPKPIDQSTWGWYPWQDYPEDYVASFKRVWHIFRREGANNVEFVWSPNFHLTDVSILKKYYPGPAYVDWIGIDGYNWQGQNVDRMINGIYFSIVNHPDFFGDKPIMIAEWGMAETLSENHTKAAWLEEALSKIKKNYPRIRAFYWFHVDKEHNWRLDETPEAWQVFVKAMQDPVFVGCLQK